MVGKVGVVLAAALGFMGWVALEHGGGKTARLESPQASLLRETGREDRPNVTLAALPPSSPAWLSLAVQPPQDVLDMPRANVEWPQLRADVPAVLMGARIPNDARAHVSLSNPSDQPLQIVDLQLLGGSGRLRVMGGTCGVGTTVRSGGTCTVILAGIAAIPTEVEAALVVSSQVPVEGQPRSPVYIHLAPPLKIDVRAAFGFSIAGQ